MIKVKYFRASGLFNYLLVSGHANYDDKGKDIVCSAVSSVTFGALNAIKNIDDFEINIKDDLVEVHAKQKISEHDDIVLHTLFVQLKTIEKNYSNYIKIEERNE